MINRHTQIFSVYYYCQEGLEVSDENNPNP